MCPAKCKHTPYTHALTGSNQMLEMIHCVQVALSLWNEAFARSVCSIIASAGRISGLFIDSCRQYRNKFANKINYFILCDKFERAQSHWILCAFRLFSRPLFFHSCFMVFNWLVSLRTAFLCCCCCERDHVHCLQFLHMHALHIQYIGDYDNL